MREPLFLHVASAAVDYGYAVCVSGPFIAVTAVCDDHVALYDVASLELVHRFGRKGSGRGQFQFYGYYCGLCAGAGPTVLIADWGNKRVSEHVLPTGDCVRLLGLTHLEGPMGVDANHAHTAVADVYIGRSRVLLFAADVTDGMPPLWVFGDEHGSLLRQLYWPRGLRLSRDGSALFVVDYGNDRVVRIAPGGDAVVVASKEAHGLKWPHDVMECVDGGLIIANTSSNQLVKVGRDGTVTRFNAPGPRIGLLGYPSGLSFCATTGHMIVRDRGGRIQLFRDNLWAGARLAWITATIHYE